MGSSITTSYMGTCLCRAAFIDPPETYVIQRQMKGKEKCATIKKCMQRCAKAGKKNKLILENVSGKYQGCGRKVDCT